MNENSIPKKIHYCWFGGAPLPELAQKCIASWKKYLPDYEITEWNESNFDVDCCAYVREAYEAGKWAFVSDYARFRILYENGGLYFDTDVEIVRPLDDILAAGPFMGLETADKPAVAPGLGLAAPAGMELFREILDDYHVSHFQGDKYGSVVTVVMRTTKVLERHGVIDPQRRERIAGVNIYPADYFCPLDFRSGKISMTPNTRTIHHYSASWLTGTQRIIQRIDAFFWGKSRPVRRLGWVLSLPWRIRNRIELIGVKRTVMRIIGKLTHGGVRHLKEAFCADAPAVRWAGGAA